MDMIYEADSDKTRERDNMGGYMTLEASVIIPLSFCCFILIILYTFYLYNHLTVYQSCYLSALRGSQLKNASNGAVKTKTEQELGKLLDEQVYMYQLDHTSSVTGSEIRVSAASFMYNLTSEYGLYNEKRLKSQRSVSLKRIDPVRYIREAD
ncbi:MAG: hypothetical protein K6E68_08775 [Lachnospiraceae bacterium]|nr:hypothetical protein [Lachnospiraceae bacterium]